MCNPVTVDLQQALHEAVAGRFQQISSGLTERTGDYVYHGRRTTPKGLGWRFRQFVVGDLIAEVPESLPGEVLAGKYDHELEEVWHDAASAEHWYRHEKRYW